MRLANTLAAGSVVGNGRFAITRVLGHGAQATTYEAVDKQSGTLVALKRFSIPHAETWKDVELAEREAEVLSQLEHPLLPRYLTHFEEQGALFLAMEKVEGKTLGQLRGSLSEEDVRKFLRDAAQVLGYLHGRAPPIIHRDIKPNNVIRNSEGRFVLVDFGSVQHRLRPEGGSTVVGTFGYMAPEQFQGRAMPATDLFAVAATALSVLSGVEPDALPHQGLAIDVPKALGRTRNDPLCGLLCEALDPDPDARSRASLSELLAKYGLLASRSSSAHVGAGAPAPGDGRGYTSQQRRNRQPRHEWRRRQRQGLFDHHGARRWLHFPPALLLVLLGLRLARVFSSMALLLVVPVFLTLLSLLFGSELRQGARRVREAGHRARRVLERVALEALRTAREPIDADRHPRVRVDPGPDEPRRARSFDEQVADFEAEAERAASQVEDAVSRRR